MTPSSSSLIEEENCTTTPLNLLRPPPPCFSCFGGLWRRSIRSDQEGMEDGSTDMRRWRNEAERRRGVVRASVLRRLDVEALRLLLLAGSSDMSERRREREREEDLCREEAEFPLEDPVFKLPCSEDELSGVAGSLLCMACCCCLR